MREIPKLGYRRIVPSPKPREILELPQIKRLVDDNQIIVCSGGGGIPVVHNEEWGYEGVEAVIDKDLSAALLALGLNADMLAIITGVDQVFLDFGQPNQKPIDRMTLTEAQGHLAAGQFPAGSMGPKIEACIHFLRDTKTADARVLITSIEAFNDALAGRTGTWITQT